MKEVIAFICDFCPVKRAFRKKGNAARHEKNCYHNPATQSCATCKHFITEPYEPETGAGGSGCKEDLRRIAEGFAETATWDLYVDDTPNLTVNQLVARARSLANKGVKLFVIDYVQLLHVPHETEARLKMSYASRAITEFTKANKVSTLVLSQLVKPKEQAGKRRPNKYDLRETGQLIDDAHLIILLHRPVGADGEEKDYEAVIIIDKQRRGLCGDIPAYFAGKHVKWQWRDETKKKAKDEKVEERDRTGESE